MPKLIYCDEYGNTGANLLDREQPVFAYAFVAIDGPRLGAIVAAIGKICADDGVDSAELKSSTLVASKRGRRRLAAIGTVLSEHRVHVVLSIVEKRYQICSMVVETYLDPVWCERAPAEMLDAEARQEFADACYDCFEDEALAEFLAAVRDDDPARIGAVGERFSAALQFHPSALVHRAARAMETEPGKLFRISAPRVVLPGHHSPSSQYAAFYPGLATMNGFLGRIGDTGSVVRDQDQQHGAFLDLAFATAQQLEESPLAAVYRATRLDRLAACESTDSRNRIGIQLADLAAGVFGRVALAALRGKHAAAELQALAACWRRILLPRSVHYVMVADAHLSEITRAILGATA